MDEQSTAVNEVVDQPTTEAESAPVENTEVASDTAEETEVSQSPETEAEQAESEESDLDEVAPDTKFEDLAPKSQNRFQTLANRNRELEARLKEYEEFHAPTKDEYIAGGYEPEEARINALEAKLAQNEAIGQVKELNLAVDNDMVRVLSEFPELDPKNEKFNEKLAQSLMSQYDKDAGAVYSEDGIVLRTNQLPYEYIKDKMDLLGLATQKERQTAQRNVEKMVAAAENPTGQAPSTGEETLEQMRERLSQVKF